MLIPLSGLGINDLNGMFGVYELPSWIAFPLTVGAVMYITNTIPMLDDVDGLAAGMSIIAFSVLGSLCYQSEQYLLLLICASMVGVLAPFLFRNVFGWLLGWRKLFFGSTGGLTIGYLLSYVVITLGQLGGTLLQNGVGMICFGTLMIPMFDVMRVAITRLVNGRNIFRGGDRNHIHHRLMTAGLSPRMVLLALLLISSAFISLNVIGVNLGVDLSLLLVIDVSVWLVMQVIIMYFKNKGRGAMDYVVEVLAKAVASTDPCRTAFSVLVPLMLSIVLGTLFVPRVLLLSRKRKLYDIPDQRKVHNRPIPRLGGVTFFPVLLISFCLTVGLWMLLELYSNPSHVDAYFPRFILLSVGMMALFLTGVADDLIGVSYQSKFLVQFLAAVLFPASGLWIHDLSGLFWLHEIPAWLGMPLTVILVVYIINAVNLIDGIDGLASGLCSISLLTLGAAAAIKGQYLFCMLSFGMLGVLLPFWFYNVFGNADKGKKIFMGDTGSLTLGYLLSFLLVYMSSLATVSFPRGMLLMGVSTMMIPLMDIPRVMLKRIREGHNPFKPDRNHIHHKLMRAGLSPLMTMLVLLMISTVLVALTVLLVILDWDKTLIFSIDVLLGIILHLLIDYMIVKKENKIHE